MFEQEFKEINKLIQESETIGIFVHKSPDHDSIGSSLALFLYVQSLGKSVRVICVDEISNFFSKIPGVENIETVDVDFSFFEKFNLLIFPDGAELNRYHKKKELNIPSEIKLIQIDHHPVVEKFTDVSVVSTEVGSTAELCFSFITQSEGKITSTMAKLLMIGILGDTGGLSYSSIKSTTFRVMADLLEISGSITDVLEMMTESVDPRVISIWDYMTKNIKFNPRLKYSYIYVPYGIIADAGLSFEEARGQAKSFRDMNFRNIKGYDINLLITDRSDGVLRGSARGDSGRVDLGKVCAQFQEGGGHTDASAFYSELSLEDTISLFEKGLEKFRI